MTIAILSHPDCLNHDTGGGHPECVDRLRVTLDALEKCDFAGELQHVEAPLATKEQLLLVHTASYVEEIENAARMVNDARPYVSLDADTTMSEGSYMAALRSAGAGCEAVDRVMGKEVTSAFCAVRPPGHHALPNRAMGFCIFNNIAIAARHAMKQHGLERVAIVDFDVHHGNGTEAMFENDPAVLYISTHQWPHWPGTGNKEETGVGNILNIPVPAGTAGPAYRGIFSAQVLPALRAHQPQFLFASAGFDAHQSDPLAGLALTEEDYRWIGAQLAATAHEHCKGRVISMLEGGYALPALARSSVEYLRAFAHAT